MTSAGDIPMDMVFTYVNGDDPAHRRKRLPFESRYPDSEVRPDTRADRDIAVRYTDAGEIGCSVNSVVKYLPWVRTIYVVTDAQVPPVAGRLLESGHVRLVDHKDFIPGEYLPTFSSRVIESCLHRIPGLSDIFLYNNDDYMHFSAVPRAAFCEATADGRSLLHLRVERAIIQRAVHATARNIPFCRPIANLHTIGISNAYALLRWSRQRIPALDIIVPWHATHVIRKTTAARLETEFGEALDANRRLKFRSVRSFSYATLLYTMEMVWNPDNRVIPSSAWRRRGEFRMFDFRARPPRDTDRLWRKVAESQVPFVCLNNIAATDRARFMEVMARKRLFEPQDGD